MSERISSDGVPRNFTGAADSLAQEVSIVTAIDSSGLSIKGKSRLLAAADRLLGGLFGVPADLVEAYRRRKAEAEHFHTEVKRLQYGKALEQLVVDDLGGAAIRHFIENEPIKQANRNAVIAECLRAADDAQTEDTGVDPKSEDSLDDDWLNLFESYAERASSDRMRQLWGRILAGEVRRPHAFSLSTLRAAAELDSEIATMFQEIARLRIGTNLILRPTDPRNDILLRFAALEEFGLLCNFSMPLNLGIVRAPQGSHLLVAKTRLLRICLRNNTAELVVPVIKISRVGSELASILPWDEEEALREAARSIASHQGIELCSFLNLGNIHNEGDVIKVTGVIEVMKATAL